MQISSHVMLVLLLIDLTFISISIFMSLTYL